MKRTLFAGIVLTLFLLHQDIWFWKSAGPFLFGFLPIALSYHALYSIAAALLMWALVKYAWPSHLDQYASESDPLDANKSARGGNTPQSAACVTRRIEPS